MRGEFSIPFEEYPLLKLGSCEAGLIDGEVVFSYTRWDWEIEYARISYRDRSTNQWVLVRAETGLSSLISNWWMSDLAKCDLADEKHRDLTDEDERTAQAADAREIA